MTKFRDLVQRARGGSLRSSEMSDPTITVTSLGETGAESVMGLIYPPQVALVGFGRLTQRVLPIEGGIGVRHAITATLSADHRVIDGHRGSVFLAALERLLQEPERL
jgi:pyruvate dehydrogenase E2 component (dihydrolipoamide acetyltransferase)